MHAPATQASHRWGCRARTKIQTTSDPGCTELTQVENANRDNIIDIIDVINHEATVRLSIVSQSGRSTLLPPIFTTQRRHDGDGRPGRSTMSPMWSGKSASVEAAMKNMLAAATQQILDQWEPFDDEDYERRDRSQQELEE